MTNQLELEENDVLQHRSGECYRIDKIGGDTIHVTHLGYDDWSAEWTVAEARSMIENGRVRSETDLTVTDIDDLNETTVYRYEHDDDTTFTVNLDYVDDDDFAGYGEGAVQFQYSDGYVSDVPVSNVKQHIEAHKIEQVEPVGDEFYANVTVCFDGQLRLPVMEEAEHVEPTTEDWVDEVKEIISEDVLDVYLETHNPDVAVHDVFRE